MFRNNTGKEFPVSSSIVLETEEGVKVSLETQADTGEEQADASGKIQPVISGLQLLGDESTAAIYLHARKQPEEPFFGPQTFLDARKGVSYRMKLLGVKRMIAIYQHKDWWIRPAFPESCEEVPERTQLLIAEGEAGYLAILAVCGEEYRTDIAGAGRELRITAASNCINKRSVDDFGVVMASGANPYQCCELAVKKALALLGKTKMFRRERTYPEMFEYFGWCSWDAFYHEVSHKGIIEKMQELKDKRIPAKWVLIDDGWLDADYKKQVLKGLDADADKFPDGLGACIREIKQDYDVKQVGVWHAVMGYWNGLEKDSSAGRKLRDESRTLEDGRIVPDTEPGRAFAFYDTWHSYLKNSCDVDFVKVDGQSAISLFYAGRKEYGRASAGIQKGLNASAALHFNNRIINCMGMAGEDMWNRPSSAISRSSDDFVPDVPHGFREHAIQNGYNSLLQGQFFWGDWDMFWSDHEENWQNSILRAVSGGPVYTSDKVGCTDGRFITPLMKKDGRLIRCEEVGMPTVDCLFENPVDTTHVLKLFNRYHENYVITALNINKEDRVCEGRIKVSDIPELAGKEWILYSYRERKAALLSEAHSYEFRLAPNDGELFLVLPAADFIPLGILEKYIGPGCVEAVLQEEGRQTVILSEEGTFGFISSREPERFLYDGKEEMLEKETITGSEACLYHAQPGNCGPDKKYHMAEIFWKGNDSSRADMSDGKAAGK